VLAGDAGAVLGAIEVVQPVQLLGEHRGHLGRGRRRGMLAAFQVARDLAEQPGTALGGAADHDASAPVSSKHPLRLRGRLDVAVRDHGDRTRDFTSAIVSYSAAPPKAQARVRPWMASSCTPADSAISATRTALRCSGPRPGTDLERHRDVHGGSHGLEDLRDQGLILEERGAGAHVADLLRRAAHV